MTHFLSWIYRCELRSKGLARWFFRGVRLLVIRVFHDPSCEMEVHGKMLRMPLSHPLPQYAHRFPYYDSLISRLADFVRRRSPLRLIDVGANVGDTIAAAKIRAGEFCLAIEPSPVFRKFLTHNFPEEYVTISDAACGAYSGLIDSTLVTSRGTGALKKAVAGASTLVSTVDALLERLKCDAEINLLKIDTDGSDIDVLKGCDRLLSIRMPAILVECDCWGARETLQGYLVFFDRLLKAGYKSVLFYDHIGLLLGKFRLADREALSALLQYQRARGNYYYDILVMREEELERFYVHELEIFS